MEFIAFVADEREGYICPSLDRRRVVLPFRAPKLENVVVYIQRQCNVEVIRADGRMWSLGLGSLEVQEADLVPEERPNVTLKRCEAARRRVAKAVDTNALSKPD